MGVSFLLVGFPFAVTAVPEGANVSVIFEVDG